jgi:nitrite reductase/ring-hydroxylating ferredoxin subunit
MLRGLLRALIAGRVDGNRTSPLATYARRREEAAARQPDASPRPAPQTAAPDGMVAAARLDEIPPGGLLEVRAGERSVVLARTAEGVFCIAATCAHAGGPLGDGTLEGTVVTCPYHGWSYDVRDGSCLVDPSVSVAVWPTEVVDGVVCVGSSA